jgi:glycosyltransferase involved in cell wall biosynthesis
MKIAIISYYSGLVERGVEVWAKEVANRMPENFSVTIFQAGPSTDSHSIMISKPFILQVLPKLIFGKFDIVIPTNGRFQAILVRLFSLLVGYKVVIFGHSGRGFDDRLNLFTFPHRFVALSGPAAYWAKGANPLVKIVHIPIGIDLSRFSPLQKPIKIPLSKPIIMANAAAITSKQLDLVIRAVANIANTSLLVVSNSGDQYSYLQELGTSLLGNRFLMRSFPNSDLPGVYKSVQLFCLTSWVNESFPVVYLEALASNLPIIATDDPVRRETIGQAGMYVDPHNTAQFAQTIQKVLKTKWGDIPRNQSQKYNYENVIDQYVTLFNSLVK